MSLFNCPSFFMTVWARNFAHIRAAYQGGDAQVPTLREQPQKFLTAARVLDRWKNVFGPLAERQAEEESMRQFVGGKKR